MSVPPSSPHSVIYYPFEYTLFKSPAYFFVVFSLDGMAFFILNSSQLSNIYFLKPTLFTLKITKKIVL